MAGICAWRNSLLSEGKSGELLAQPKPCLIQSVFLLDGMPTLAFESLVDFTRQTPSFCKHAWGVSSDAWQIKVSLAFLCHGHGFENAVICACDPQVLMESLKHQWLFGWSQVPFNWSVAVAVTAAWIASAQKIGIWFVPGIDMRFVFKWQLPQPPTKLCLVSQWAKPWLEILDCKLC